MNMPVQNEQRNYLSEAKVALDENASWKKRYKHLVEALDNPSEKVQGNAARTLTIMKQQADFMESTVSKDKRLEAVFTNNLGSLVPKVVDLVRIFYPNMIAQELVDIQPMDRMNGQVFQIKPVFSNTAAGVTAGTQMFSNVTDGTYASEEMTVSLTPAADGTVKTFTGTFPILPVRKGTVTVKLNSATSAMDDGKGNLVGTGVTGTVDYGTGALSVTYTTAPTAGATLAGFSRYDSEQSPDNIRQVEIQLNSFPVQAKPHPLRVRWSELSALAAQAHLDLDIPDTISNLAASFIKQERDIKLCNHIIAAATPDTNLNFDATWTTSTNYSKLARYAEIELKLNYGESKIQRTLGRGGISWILAGTDAADLFRQCNGFQAEPVQAPIGPHKIGTLRDGTVAIIKNPFMDKDTYVLGFKGYVVGDAATILAEWIPLYASPNFQAPDLNNYQGMMSLYDLVDNNTSYYLKGTISNYAA